MPLIRRVKVESIITTNVTFPDEDGDTVELTTRNYDTASANGTRTAEAIALNTLTAHGNAHANALSAAISALATEAHA